MLINFVFMTYKYVDGWCSAIVSYVKYVSYTKYE